MKKIFSLILIALFLISLCGCEGADTSLPKDDISTTVESASFDTGSQSTTELSRFSSSIVTTATTAPTEAKPITHSDGKATLPLTGFCGVSDDNKIIIKTDYVGYASGELTPVEEAYAYQNEELIRLKAFDIKLVLRDDVLGRHETITLPVRYFVYESTVYAYAMELPYATSVKFIPIPNDSEHVLLTGGLVKREVLVNVIDGTCELLITDYPDYTVLWGTMSEDGSYVVVLAGSSYDILHDANSCQYVFDFRNKKLTKIPMPEYDSEEFPYTNFTCWTVINDTVLFTGSFGDRERYNKKVLWYEFDVSNGVVKQRADLTGFSDERSQYRPYPYIIIHHDSVNGLLSIANMKEKKRYMVSCEKNAFVSVSPNETGAYLLLRYLDEQTAQSYKTVILDAKNDKELDMSTVIPNYKEDKYKGQHISSIQWCGETALLISYSSDPSFVDQAQFRVEIVELPVS